MYETASCRPALFVLLTLIGACAFSKEPDAAASQPVFSQGQTSGNSESSQVVQQLESLRDSYRQRLAELDHQLNEFGIGSVVLESSFEDVSHAAETSVTNNHYAAPAETSSWDNFIADRLQVTLGGGGKLKLYGYARADLIYADSQLSNTVVPFFAVSEDSTNNNDGQFDVNVRLTRLGLDFSDEHSEWLNCAELSAKVEIDFETLVNLTSESRAVPRIRHAYGEMRWDEFSILAGQTWDVISPLLPTINDDSLMWNAGNLGDRRPMIRAMFDSGPGAGNRLVVAGAISSGGAIDGKDLDGNGVKDGEDSGLPALQGRVGFDFPNWVSGHTVGLGVWGFVSFESIAVPIMGNDEFTSRGVGIDWNVPLLSWLAFRGEAWHGRNLSDWRGGAGQGVNTTTGREIESSGGWAELQFEPSEIHTLALGITADDPSDADLVGNATERTLNWTGFVGNRFHFGGGLSIYVNAEFWNTEYLTLRDGDAMRFKTVLIQRF